MQKTLFFLLIIFTIIGFNCPMMAAEINTIASAADKKLKLLRQVNIVHIRSLAASCAACHGTNGNSIGKTPSLAGMDPAYFLTRMQAFKSGELAVAVMNRHAKGLTMQEIKELSAYFSFQKPKESLSPHTQKLSSHSAN